MKCPNKDGGDAILSVDREGHQAIFHLHHNGMPVGTPAQVAYVESALDEQRRGVSTLVDGKSVKVRVHLECSLCTLRRPLESLPVTGE